MKTKTHIKAGSSGMNHNETLTRAAIETKQPPPGCSTTSNNPVPKDKEKRKRDMKPEVTCRRNVITGIGIAVLAVGITWTSSGSEMTDDPGKSKFIKIDVPGAVGVTWPFGINSRGDIVGYYVDSSGNSSGFLFREGLFRNIDVNLPGALAGSTQAFGINPQGSIVGLYVATGSPPTHGFLLKQGNFIAIDVPVFGQEATVAQAINSRGDIVGFYYDSSGDVHGFLLSEGKFTSVDVPGAAGFSDAQGINSRGDIVGNYVDSDRNEHGFVLSGGKFTSIDVPGTSPGSTEVLGINSRGDIVGGYFDEIDLHGFVSSNGTFKKIDVPVEWGFGVQAFGINSKGDIVGTYFDSSFNMRGFLMKADK